MPDEYAVLVRNFLASAGLTYGDVTGVVIGSVVPALTLAFAEVAERYLQRRPLIVNAHTPIGIRIDIDQPEQAGPDRYINAAAVAALHGGPAIVVDFGTATTFDVVGADGSYRGGAIAPGILVAHDALVSRAARLHKIDLQPPPSAIGRNTIHAMQSGIFLGYIALIEGMVARIKAAMPEPDETITVIATGGLAPLFKQHTPIIDQIEPELTLEGLRIIYALNQPR
jgi:type III pantothenate kinase